MLIAFAIGLFALWQWRRIYSAIARLLHSLSTPGRKAERTLLLACQKNDALAAEYAWLAWQDLQVDKTTLPKKLLLAIDELQRHLYASQQQGVWAGISLRNAFRAYCRISKRTEVPVDELARLNLAWLTYFKEMKDFQVYCLRK
jgi:hypothetical protein